METQTLTVLQNLLFLSVLLRVRSWLPLVLDGVLPSVLVLPHTLWIQSGTWLSIINNVLLLTLYCSRRMMMTSGSGVNYKSMFDAGSQVRVIRL